MLGLLAAVFVAARRITGPALDAFLLAGTILAFPEGRHTLLSPHADALAVAFAVAGLVLIDSGRRGKAILGVVALLFALSVGAKLSSVAGCTAACVFLLRQERRPAVWLMGMMLLLRIAGFVLLQGSSDGRFLENFRPVGSGGLALRSLLDGPKRLLQALVFSTR